MIITGLDLETTGLHQVKGDRIIEICLIKVEYSQENHEMVLIEKYTQRINPQIAVSKNSTEIHGITNKDLILMPTFEKVVNKIDHTLNNTEVLVAHNMEFDGPFLAGEYLRIGKSLPTCKTFCTMENARWATPLGKLPKLKELCFSLDVTYDDSKAHAAEYDTLVMLQCLKSGLIQKFYKL